MKKRKLTPKQKQLAADWEKMMKAHEKPLERGAKAKASGGKPVPVSKMPDLRVPEHRSSRHVQSLDSGKGSTAKGADKVYTGTKMVGLATMHKSNTVPIFNEDAAKDVAKMRR